MGTVRIMRASAGSGKTFQLAYNYIRTVIGDPALYRQILAVTFTNKATEEMKRRIIGQIDALAKGEPTPYSEMLCRDLNLSPEKIRERAATASRRILHDYSRFSILTIDKFFQRIIRSFIKELGLDIDFTLELQTENLLSAACDALIDDISVDESLKRWIAGFVEEKIEENRRWDIKKGLAELGSELFRDSYKKNKGGDTSRDDLNSIVSAATARSAAITTRLKRNAAAACDSFMKRGLSVTDFAYGRSGVAGYLQKTASGEISPPGKRVRDALRNADSWMTKTCPNRQAVEQAVPELQNFLVQICSDYDSNIAFLNSTGLLRENYRNFALLSDLAQRIEKICSGENILPISETNGLLSRLIDGNEVPFIFEKAGNYFSRFMIDEFQDTSTVQWENFLPLIRNAVSQTEGEAALLVGDVKQSIYRWRGGDWRILASDISERFDSVSEDSLITNYRSAPLITRFNNLMTEAVTGRAAAEIGEELDEARQQGTISQEKYHELRAMVDTAYNEHSQDTPFDKDQGYTGIEWYSPDIDSGAKIPPVVRCIEDLQSRGYRAGEIAVLVRYNHEGAAVANILLEHKRSSPDSPYVFDIVTQEALTVGSAPVSDFITSCFSLSVNISDRLQWAVYNKWLGKPLDSSPDDGDENFLRSLIHYSPVEAFEYVIRRYRLDELDSSFAYIQAYHDLLIGFCKSRVGDIALFLDWWKETGSSRPVNIPAGENAINITTIHKSKGLQYKAVIIPYCNWSLVPGPRTVVWARDKSPGTSTGLAGAFPVGYREKMKDSFFSEDYYNETVLSYIDNLNTYYVAATRAVDELHIMIPESGKSSFGRIDCLIRDSLQIDGDKVCLGELDGRVEDSQGMKLGFGKKNVLSRSDGPNSDEAGASVAFPSYPVSDRLRLRFPGWRYGEDSINGTSVMPRDFGILMHRVFENSNDINDIRESISRLREEGIISSEEESVLGSRIEEVLQHPVVSEWFNGKYSDVKIESRIILPGSFETRKPDRVMISGDKVVVVDYKFGIERRSSHGRQVREYATLLGNMGYSNVEGYVWYVSLGDLEKIA